MPRDDNGAALRDSQRSEFGPETGEFAGRGWLAVGQSEVGQHLFERVEYHDAWLMYFEGSSQCSEVVSQAGGSADQFLERDHFQKVVIDVV